MYKYQEEVIDNIDSAIDTMEQMTEANYRVHIGYRNDNLNEQNIQILN